MKVVAPPSIKKSVPILWYITNCMSSTRWHRGKIVDILQARFSTVFLVWNVLHFNSNLRGLFPWVDFTHIHKISSLVRLLFWPQRYYDKMDGYLASRLLFNFVKISQLFGSYSFPGTEVLTPGERCGSGLSETAAQDLGLPAGTAVSTGMIDAHSGGLGKTTNYSHQTHQTYQYSFHLQYGYASLDMKPILVMKLMVAVFLLFRWVELERRNSIAHALELRLFFTNPSIW